MDEGDRDGASTYWTDLCFVSSTGSRTITMKINFYPRLQERMLPCYFWEVRRFIDAIRYKNKEGIYKIIKVHLVSWKEESRLFGLRWADHFRASTKSAVTLKITLNKCSPEFEVSNDLMLAITLRALGAGWSKQRSADTLSFATALFNRLLVCRRDAEDALDAAVADDVLHLCDDNSVDGLCTHIQDIVEIRKGFASQAVPERCVNTLLQLRAYVIDVHNYPIQVKNLNFPNINL